MPETFDVLSAIPSQRLADNGVTIVDTIEATAVTKPNGVNFSATVDKTPGWRDRLLAALAEEAAELESLFTA